MIIGSQDRFAIQFERFDAGFGSFCFWVGGLRFGDIEQLSMVEALCDEADDFLKRPTIAAPVNVVDMPFDQLREWTTSLMRGDEFSDPRDADNLVRAMFLFPYATEGLAGIRLFVSSDQSGSLIVAWDVDDLSRQSRVRLQNNEPENVVRRFVELVADGQI